MTGTSCLRLSDMAFTVNVPPRTTNVPPKLGRLMPDPAVEVAARASSRLV